MSSIKFKLEVNTESFANKIDHSKKVMFIGSCFSDNIGAKLCELKIPCLVNPFGVLYNPQSVMQSLRDIVNLRIFNEEDLYFYRQRYISFAHHGSFSGSDKFDVLDKINKGISNAHKFLKDANLLYITFGTFRAYKLLKNNMIVANCHKLPHKEFENFLLNIDDVFASYNLLIDDLKKFNPDLDIIFTVSPVRHWKDGAVNNQISKSYLFILIHKLLEKHNHTHYFPAYEIMIDDLRDYRFYADDLLHPNALAVSYIWEKFEDCFFSSKTKELVKRIKQIQKNLNHKAFYPESEEYKKFAAKNKEQMLKLEKEIMGITN